MNNQNFKEMFWTVFTHNRKECRDNQGVLKIHDNYLLKSINW